MTTHHFAGYEPDAYPIQADEARRNNVATYIKENRLKLVASALTFESITVGAMLRNIEDNRDVFQTISLVGPLVLDGEIVPGNAIGVYEHRTARI